MATLLSLSELVTKSISFTIYPVIADYLSRMVRKPEFCLCENKGADQLRSKIITFVFAKLIVRFLFFLIPKFQASVTL